MKKNMTKKIMATSLALLLSITTMISPVKGEVIYENVVKETICNGVVYEKKTQITGAGLVDVNILRIDMNNPNLEIKPIYTSTYGNRDTVLSMVNENGALAGINGDFFDMNLYPNSPFGTVVKDGELISVDEEHKGYATFFIDDENNPFIEYIEPDIVFLNNGQNNIKVHAMNKYKRDFSAVYFDRNAITTTKELDEKFSQLVKVVVDNGKITYISGGGEVVEVPENGYIIVMAASYSQHFQDSVKVGDTAEIKIDARFDFNKMEQAIGGAGKILENGNYSNYGYVVGPNARNPRSAIGINQAGNEIIMIAVDGRNHSAGATHQEMAEIMKNAGAWNGMHLDGGGSTTMVGNTHEREGTEVLNALSGGSRKITNSLGVFNTAPVGTAETIKFTLSDNKVFAGTPIEVNTVGIDSNGRKTTLEGGVNYSSTDQLGVWNGNTYTPMSDGFTILTARYNGNVIEEGLDVLKLAQLVPLRDSLGLTVGDTATLSFEGISTTGKSAPINGVQYEVVPAELGTMEGNVFTAKGGNSGYIKCYIGNVVTYIDVSIGTELKWMNNFNDPTAKQIKFVTSDSGVTGKVYYSDKANTPGNNALAMDYTFSASDKTQAAYLEFISPIPFEKGLSGIRISAYGLYNGGWLRARIIDANGDYYLLDLSKDFNQKGWAAFEGKIPDTAVEPVSLDRFYIASLSNTDTNTKTIYFDDLGGMYATKLKDVDRPASTVYSNPYKADLSTPATDGSFDITVVGNIVNSAEEKPENYLEVQNNNLNKFKTNSSKLVYASNSDLENPGANHYKWSGNYNFTVYNNYAIAEMSASKGGLASTNPNNWNFVNQGKSTPVKNIIIIMDKKPSNFNKVEYDLFKNALEEIKATGKNIFVISTEGTSTSSQMIDNVNYINLGSLYSGNSVNNKFSSLRIRISGDNIYYQLEK